MLIAKLSASDIASLTGAGLGLLTAVVNLVVAKLTDGQHKSLTETIKAQVTTNAAAVDTAKAGLEATNQSLQTTNENMRRLIAKL